MIRQFTNRRRAYRFCLLLAVLLQLAPGSCNKGAGVSKFVSDKGQSYFELKDDRGTHKVYSTETDGSALIFVLDKKNVPEVVALISKEGKAYVFEYRAERGVPPTGLALIDASYMSSISSRNPAFDQWRSRLAVFKVPAERRSKTFKFAKQGQEPLHIQIDNNGIRVAALAECRLDVSSPAGFKCAQSIVCICSFKALCDAVTCLFRIDGNCFQDLLAKWAQCQTLGTYQQGEGGDEGDLKDVPVSKLNGVYNLSY